MQAVGGKIYYFEEFTLDLRRGALRRGHHQIDLRPKEPRSRLGHSAHVDVLFTDIVMPDQDGIELAQMARKLRPKLLIMFATGYFSRAADASLLGRLLFKPMRAHEIDAVLDQILRYAPGPTSAGAQAGAADSE